MKKIISNRHQNQAIFFKIKKHFIMIQLWYEKAKITLKINKPGYAGICILDFSKVLMYEFYYNYIGNKYSSKSRLLFTGTDSLMHEIKDEDFYEDF